MNPFIFPRSSRHSYVLGKGLFLKFFDWGSEKSTKRYESIETSSSYFLKTFNTRTSKSEIYPFFKRIQIK